MDSQVIKNDILNKAEDFHIAEMGFATATPFLDALMHYQKRLDKGFTCELEQRDEEEDLLLPQKLFRDAKSIIVILEPYKPYLHDKVTGKGWIASGAAGVDYHHIVNDKLELLALYIKKTYNINAYKVVDTSPLSDRAMAVRSGLGIIRRNGMFYHKTYGSYCYIGALLIDRELDILDKKQPVDPCGRCRRCVAYCPGGAITDDYEINSNLCVSYLTQKRDLALEESHKLGHYIYGCDVCQSVCPANRLVKVQEEDTFVEHSVDLQSLLNISNSDFKNTFRKSTCGWRGKKMLQRNSLIVLGNQKNTVNTAIIKPYINDERKDIALYAEDAYRRLEDK